VVLVVRVARRRLADMWTDTADAAEYERFLSALQSAISDGEQSDFLSDGEIERGAARPPGFDEAGDKERRRAVKSKFMQDAQDRARER
jgi:hypothetical protein